MADNITLREMAKNAGWNVEYDQAKNNVKILNPETGKAISFVSGQGSEYGLGGLVNGNNVVADRIKLGSFLVNPAVAPGNVAGQGYVPGQGLAQGGATGGTTGTTNGTVQQTTTPAAKEPTIEERMEQAKQSRINAAVSNLKNRYSQTVSEINAKKEQLAPTYDAKRLTAQSGSQLQAKNFAEFLANRGLARSGTSQQAELMRNMALQGELAGLNKQQNDELSYYNRMADSAKNALDNDMAAAENEATASYLDNFLKYKMEQETLKNQQDFQREMNKKADEYRELQITQGKYDLDKTKRNDAIDSFNKSIAGLGTGYDYQGEINKIKNDGDPTNDWQINSLLQAMNKAKEASFNNAVNLSELTGSIDANQLIGQMSQPEIKSYESLQSMPGGFAAAMNATNDERQKKIIEAFRNRYLEANPDNPYYNTRTTNTMVPTLKGQTTQSALQTDSAQRKGLEIANRINQIKLDNAPEEAKIAIKIANEQLKNGELQNAYQTIINSNADKKIKAEIDNIYANAYQSREAGKHAGDGASVAADRLAWEKDAKNPDNILKLATANSKPEDKDSVDDIITKSYVTNDGVNYEGLAQYLQQLEASGYPADKIQEKAKKYGIPLKKK